MKIYKKKLFGIGKLIKLRQMTSYSLDETMVFKVHDLEPYIFLERGLTIGKNVIPIKFRYLSNFN